ncbi:MAG: VWA domain-containing protein [Clostridia bacterium]|nr:VWA domain-containing protein [Clostridia bacterium]
MKNISFDNPFLLLIAVPMLLLIVLPFIRSVNKDNKTRSTTASLILHLAILICVTLGVAGTTLTTVITRTEVWVLADVSYSSNRNLGVIDGYIDELSDKLPRNSDLGVICFGRNQVVKVELGDRFSTVRDSGADDSATDISAALQYASERFSDDSIKRIVLITDGNDTASDADGKLVAAVDALYAKNIKIDSIYLNNNIPEGEREVQISDVYFTPSTYVNHESVADVLVTSSYSGEAILNVRSGDVLIDSQAIRLENGYNVINVTLPTDEVGEFDYALTVEAEEDTSPYNNSFSFTQCVTGDLNVLLVSGSIRDKSRAEALYAGHANIDAYIRRSDVPCSIEELVKYDEIILSNLDIRDIDNYSAFIEAIDKAVSVYGKSLVTMGDLVIQNKTEEILQSLEDMLPVKFGNNARDPQLYIIVIDTSRSMQLAEKLILAKDASKQLISLLTERDYVSLVEFNATAHTFQSVTRVTDPEALYNKIDDLKPKQGTVIGTSLKEAGKYAAEMTKIYSKVQIMLISDGLSYSMDADNPVEVATDLYEQHGIVTSVISPNNNEEQGKILLGKIAERGGGKCYNVSGSDQLHEVVFEDIADQITDSVIYERSPVHVENLEDGVMSGIAAIPDVFGYVYMKEKGNATVPLTLDYRKNSESLDKVPLYAYWDYGNGRVSSLAVPLNNEWTEGWAGTSADTFLCNIITDLTPDERIDYPYTLDVVCDGTYSNIEITPAIINPYATVTVKVTSPDGASLEEELLFDSSKYSYSFPASAIGKYTVDITYAFSDREYLASSTFTLSYYPEYDSFALSDPASLHAAIRNRGTVTESAVPEIVNDESEVSSYEYRFTVPLLILAALMYIVDIIIRKLKWSDIRSFFGRKKKGGVR